MGFNLTVLGSSAAVPTKYRNLSCHVLEHQQVLYLIDCGEGSQLQMLKYEIKRNRIEHVFITHLHGDHYLGLPGLLNTMSLDGRTKMLNIYAPKGLQDYLYAAVALADSPGWNFPVHFVDLEENATKIIYENKYLTVIATPIIHRIPTWGFIFREKEKERNISRDFIEEYHPDFFTIKEIKKGADFTDASGRIILNDAITLPPLPPRSYAYFSDTRYDERLAEHIMGIDTLYHEATFSDAEEELAFERFHATAREAALLAKQAGVRQLLLGHISARFLNDTSLLEQQAREVFSNSVIVRDGDRFIV